MKELRFCEGCGKDVPAEGPMYGVIGREEVWCSVECRQKTLAAPEPRPAVWVITELELFQRSGGFRAAKVRVFADPGRAREEAIERLKESYGPDALIAKAISAARGWDPNAPESLDVTAKNIRLVVERQEVR